MISYHSQIYSRNSGYKSIICSLNLSLNAKLLIVNQPNNLCAIRLQDIYIYEHGPWLLCCRKLTAYCEITVRAGVLATQSNDISDQNFDGILDLFFIIYLYRERRARFLIVSKFQNAPKFLKTMAFSNLYVFEISSN